MSNILNSTSFKRFATYKDLIIGLFAHYSGNTDHELQGKSIRLSQIDAFQDTFGQGACMRLVVKSSKGALCADPDVHEAFQTFLEAHTELIVYPGDKALDKPWLQEEGKNKGTYSCTIFAGASNSMWD